MTEEERLFDLAQMQIGNAIAVGHIAMRVERDKRDWLMQAIRHGRHDLRKAIASPSEPQERAA